MLRRDILQTMLTAIAIPYLSFDQASAQADEASDEEAKKFIDQLVQREFESIKSI